MFERFVRLGKDLITMSEDADCDIDIDTSKQFNNNTQKYCAVLKY